MANNVSTPGSQPQQQQQQEWSPFVGPRSFRRDAQEQTLFFGRTYETERIISLIYSHKLVLVYAESGAGKTSIFNASVIPTLEQRRFDVLTVARVGIGTEVSVASLGDQSNINTVMTTTTATSSTDTTNVIESRSEFNPYISNAFQSLLRKQTQVRNISLSEFLAIYFPHKLDQKMGRQVPRPQVLVFDQLEELFNLYVDPDKWHEQQTDFFKQITQALEKDPLLRVVIIIREDYLARLDPFAELLPEKLKARFRLERLHKDAAIEAIKGPLEKAKAYVSDERIITKLFDEGIIDKLIEDLQKIHVETFGGKYREINGDYVEPIQLQVVCQRLWNKVIHSRVDQISKDEFGYLGDVDKALEDFYVDAINEASKQTGIEEDTIRKWFEENLITSSGTRSAVHRGSESTGGLSNNVVNVLENKYLIRKEERAGAQWYELTHDRLIKPIQDSNKEWKDKLEKERQKTFAELWLKAVAVSKLQSGNADQVLAAFYEKVIKKSIKKTRIREDELRNWCESKLITPGGTRAVVHKVNSSVDGIPNKVADVLEEEYLIRKEERSGAQWYELTHDKLIKPIKDSNKKWYGQRGKSRKKFLKVVLPCSIVGIIGIYFLASSMYSHYVTHFHVFSLIESGNLLDKSGNYVAAIQSFDEALAIEGNNLAALTGEGKALDNMDNVSGANWYFNRALGIDPKSLSALIGKGNALLEMSNVSGANWYFDKALAISANNIDALIGKGKALSDMDNIYEANKTLNKAYVLYPNNVDLLFSRAELLWWSAGNTAMRDIPRALAMILPKDALHTFAHLPRLDPLEIWRAAATKDPRDFVALTVLADNAGNPTIKEELYDKALDVNGNYKYALEGKASALKDEGNYPGAIKYYNLALKVDPNYGRVLTDEGLLFIDRLKNYTGALHLFDKAFAVDPNELDPANRVSYGFFRIHDHVGYLAGLGKYREALQLYDRNLEISPSKMVLNPNTNMVYVANSGNNTVSVINDSSGQVKNVTVGMSPRGISFNPNTNMVYVANSGSNTVSVIDGKTNDVVKTIPVGNSPLGISFNPNTNMVYVANSGNNTVSVINDSSGQVKNVTVGMSPRGISFNPNTNMVYVANSGSNTVSVIDGKTNDVVKTIPVGRYPFAIAFSPNTNLVYVDQDPLWAVIINGTTTK